MSGGIFATLRYGQAIADMPDSFDAVDGLEAPGRTRGRKKGGVLKYGGAPKEIANRLGKMQARAFLKRLEFDLTVEWLQSKMACTHCEVTGIEFSGTGSDPFSRTIDRVNNAIGYTQANCKVVVWIYNNAKGKFSHDDLMVMVRALSK